MHLLDPVILSEAKDLCTFRAVGSSPSRGYSDVSRVWGEHVSEVEPPCHPERSEGPMYFPPVGSSPSRGYSDVSRFSGKHVSEVEPPCHPERSEGPMYFPRDRQFPCERVLRYVALLGESTPLESLSEVEGPP
jgi:hypothetical protein